MQLDIDQEIAIPLKEPLQPALHNAALFRWAKNIYTGLLGQTSRIPARHAGKLASTQLASQSINSRSSRIFQPFLKGYNRNEIHSSTFCTRLS